MKAVLVFAAFLLVVGAAVAAFAIGVGVRTWIVDRYNKRR